MGLVLVLSAVVLLGFVAVVLHLRALGRDVRALAAAVQDQGHDRRPEHASTVLPPVPPRRWPRCSSRGSARRHRRRHRRRQHQRHVFLRSRDHTRDDDETRAFAGPAACRHSEMRPVRALRTRSNALERVAIYWSTW